jgi:hypothetical protein
MTMRTGIKITIAMLVVSSLFIAVLIWSSEVQATAAARGESCTPYAFQVCRR